MKKFVRILAALAVTVAAFAFVSCADGYAVPGDDGNPVVSGAGSGSAASIPAGTYNLVSMSDGTTTVTSADTDAWAAIPDSFKTLTVTDSGMTFMGTDFSFAETAIMEAAGVSFETSGDDVIITFDDGSDTAIYTYTSA